MLSILENNGFGATWGPVIDGTIIAVQPSSAGVKVPSIIGTTTDEGTAFVILQYGARFGSLSQTDYDSMLAYNFGSLAATVNETYPISMFSETQYPAFYAMSTVITDYSFRCTAHRALLAGIANGVSVYTYEFDHTPSCPWLPNLPAPALPIVMASHTADVPFVFGVFEGNCTFTPAEKKLSAFMRAAWTNMASAGKPGAGWPTFSANASQGMNLSDAAVVSTVDYSMCEF